MKPTTSCHPKTALRTDRTGEISILLVGMPPAGLNQQPEIRIAASQQEAMEILRVLQFDLVLISPGEPMESPWEFAAVLRRFWPWQRWAFLSPNPSDDDQRRAYQLGVCAIFDSLPPRHELRRIARMTSSKMRLEPDTT